MRLPLERIFTKLRQEHLDGLIVSLPANITYLTNFISRDSYFLVSRRGCVYFTDSRYLEEVKKRLKKIASISKINGSVFKLIAEGFKTLGIKRIGFEARHLPYAEYKKLKQESGRGIDLVPTCNLVEDLRKIKNGSELKKIKRAIEITSLALKFVKGFICAGKKEIEVAAELERFTRYNGASGTAFDIIVASGENSSFPHHITSQRRIRKNEPVLVDIGIDFCGYKSDLTRVFFLGKIPTAFKKIYDIVLNAQHCALKVIKPGIPVNRVDRAARQYITQQGFNQFFGHGLGHGIGLEVHEAPHLSPKDGQRLAQGMVFTVEPAIYLPGKYGVRLEDVVLVSKKGVEVLSGTVDKST